MWSISYRYHYNPNEWFSICGLNFTEVREFIQEKERFGVIEFNLKKE